MLLEHYFQLWIMFIPLYLAHIYLSARGKGRVLGVVVGFFLIILGLSAWLDHFEYINGYQQTSTANGTITTNITTLSDLDTLTMGDMSLRSVLAILIIGLGIYHVLVSSIALMH